MTSDAAADAVDGRARNARTAARTSLIAAATVDRVPARAFGLKSREPSLIEFLRVEERLFAGTFTPRSARGARLSGRCSDSEGSCDSFCTRPRGQPGHAGLGQPSAE